MTRNARKLRVGVAGCAVAVAASLMSAAPAEAAPSVPLPSQQGTQVDGFLSLLGAAANGLGLTGNVDFNNSPLTPVTNIGLAGVPNTFLGIAVGSCEGGKGSENGPYSHVNFRFGFQCGRGGGGGGGPFSFFSSFFSSLLGAFGL
jgi:hypothetical protein